MTIYNFFFFLPIVFFSVPVDNQPSSPPPYETMRELVRLPRKLDQIKKTQCQVKGLTICQKEVKYKTFTRSQQLASLLSIPELKQSQ